MSISLITGGAVNGSSINDTDVTLTFPGGVLEDDVVIFYGGHGARLGNDNSVGPVTSGYTTIFEHESNTNNVPSAGIWYKVMGASPDSNVVGEAGSAFSRNATAYGCYILRGVHADVLDQTSEETGPTSSTNPNPPVIVTQTNGAWVIIAAVSQIYDTSRGTVTDYTNLNGNAGNDLYDVSIDGATREISTAGSEDPSAWSSWSSANWYAFTIALKPGTPAITTSTSSTSSSTSSTSSSSSSTSSTSSSTSSTSSSSSSTSSTSSSSSTSSTSSSSTSSTSSSSSTSSTSSSSSTSSTSSSTSSTSSSSSTSSTSSSSSTSSTSSSSTSSTSSSSSTSSTSSSSSTSSTSTSSSSSTSSTSSSSSSSTSSTSSSSSSSTSSTSSSSSSSSTSSTSSSSSTSSTSSSSSSSTSTTTFIIPIKFAIKEEVFGLEVKEDIKGIGADKETGKINVNKYWK